MTLNYKGDEIRANNILGLNGVDLTKWPTSDEEIAVMKSNIGYSIVLTAGLVSIGQLNMVDGVVNPFSNETDIDLAASSGQVYDAVGDLYTNGPGSPVESFSAPVGVASAGNAANASYRSVIAGSAISTSGAFCRVTLEGQAAGEGMLLDNVSIGESSGTLSNTVAVPVEFKFGGNSGTGIVPAGSSITSDWLEFAIDETKTYVLIVDMGSDTANDWAANPDAIGGTLYLKGNDNSYNVSTPVGFSVFGSDNVVGITKLEITNANGNVTLQSTAITANAEPTEAHISFLITPGEAITPDVDLSGFVSRDGGTTFTKATLSTQAVGFPWQTMFRGGVDLSGQPSGSSVKWRFVSANNKTFNFENISLLWN